MLESRWKIQTLSLLLRFSKGNDSRCSGQKSESNALEVLSQTGCRNPLLSSLSSFLKALHCFFFVLLLYIRRTGTWKNCRLKLNSLPSDLFSIVNNLLQAVPQLLEWIPNQISTLKF
ncbi:hypothetical protein LINPERPRIM_LOCUS33144 [Linum perenne]